MSNTTVTPRMRSYGWNTHLVATPRAFHFAGVYQHHDNAFMTFRDIIDELRLCFELPDSTVEEDSWNGVAFGLDQRNRDNAHLAVFVKEEELDTVVPSLLSLDAQERAIVRLIMRSSPERSVPHPPRPLYRTPYSSVTASCATHIPRLQRRHDPCYLPPKKASEDARVAKMPLRKRAKPRTGSQSPKREHSGSASPDKDGEETQPVSDMIIPVTEDINRTYAQKVMDSFRSSVMVSAKRCAMTGKGQSWCVSPAIGPSLQACHIVPQQQFHVYPDSSNGQDLELSSRRLHEAWLSTWAPANGILMMSHIHEFFDARLFSIHPETFRIRAFVPYDAILDYHGCIANVPQDVDRAALAHHYDMCCIENMAANMLLPELTTTTLTSRAATSTSGTNSPFTARSDLPATPGLDTYGDPSKRTRTVQETSEYHQDGGIDARERKRKRQRVDVFMMEDTELIRETYFDSHVTPLNSQHFLADVNFELGKLVDYGEKTSH
ncbi:hypothetical protein FDENT_11738 [Fusarium denticulatum]|uniref:HNH nuclease domain-containing protein n=1 Tax=Fusarium denticulatum TaxID=48507 RepID=A0A8H5TG73_9HYPO|nr:hypothetical protein FDENT_11738 [Fusarium denticulatum]